MSPTAKKTLVAVALLGFVAAIALGLYVYRAQRPLAGAMEGNAPGVLNLLPGDAPVLAYLDAKTLRTTQNAFLQTIASLALPSPQQDPDYTAFVQGTGFDYSRDLDRAAVALWPANLGAGSKAANGPNENPTLVIADGHFDQQRIKAYALRTGRTTMRGSQTIYEVPGSPTISFEFLSATRVAIASGKNATDLLTGSGVTGPAVTSSTAITRDPETQARIDRVAGAPLFAVARADRLPASIYSGLDNSPQLKSLVRSIQAVTLAGVPKGDALSISLDGECDSMLSAQRVGTVLQGLLMIGSMAIKDPKQRGDMTPQQAAFLSALLADAKVTTQDKWVRATLDLTPAILGSGSPQHQ